jgi:hypothetical protein
VCTPCTLPCEYTGMTRQKCRSDAALENLYNFEPWTLAYVGIDPTARSRTPVHATAQSSSTHYIIFLRHAFPPRRVRPPRTGVRIAVGHENTRLSAFVFSYPPTTSLVYVGRSLSVQGARNCCQCREQGICVHTMYATM